MHYDAVIIGAGMSGLAAGIRLALFDKRVCIVEKHYAYGGLNSYYNLNGRRFDVGLHALTNYVPPGRRSAPLPKLLRQLRLSRDELDLCEQRGSEVRFHGRRLRFTNDLKALTDEITRGFPGDADNFVEFLERLHEVEYGEVDKDRLSARRVLSDTFHDPLLIEMLLCPVMYYGSPTEGDMEFADFATIFKSIFCEGLARPRQGIVGLLKPLVRRFRACGGKLRMQCGAERIHVRGNRVTGVKLQAGETLNCDTVLSSAGLLETMRLCDGGWMPDAGDGAAKTGRLSFVESFLVLDKRPADLGFDQTVVFFCDQDAFDYACPDEPVDLRSGVICCPNNYERHDDVPEGLVRVTWLANYDRWATLGADAYAALKRKYLEAAFDRAEKYMPAVREHVVFTDMFTPRTIESFTGHIQGAVYGSPQKCRDGRTPLENLFLCGTDQGLVGIIGALMSGVTMANRHVLAGP